VKSSNSVRRLKSKDTKSKYRVLKNTNVKSSTTHVRKMSHSASIDFNKREIKNSNVCQSNARVLSTKIVNVVNDGLNIVCVSCGKDLFLLSHEKCVARYALSRNSNVKRALFTTPIAAKSKNLEATSVVVKSRLSIVKTLTVTNRVSGIVRFGNDHFAAITGYGDYVQGNLTICHVYYIEGLDHNLFLVGQFFDGDLDVAFHSNTCYVRNLEGNDLLTGSRDSNLYIISIFDMVAYSLVYLMSRATSTKSWLWHRRLSHLNFGTINQLMSKDLVDGLPKFKYNKDHLCSACEQGKSKKALLSPKLVPSTKSKLELLHMDLCGLMRISLDRSYCYCLFYTRYNKTPYVLIQGRKPNIQYLHMFKSLCYPTNDRDGLGKIKPKANIGIFIGYSESLRGFCIYNRRTKKIMEMIHVQFDELTVMAFEYNNLEPETNYMNFQDSSEDLQSIPSKTDLDNLFGPLYEEYSATSLQEVPDNTAATTFNNENTSSSSLIVIEEDEAPQIVSSSAEQLVTEPNSLVLNENTNELLQENDAEFNGNVFYNTPQTPILKEDESSSTC
nr:integrase, catalytic region, zinc finger, CCHC-type, peptidase aspartic, catalytic [Tanacetum cinerariifolium]